MKYPFLSIALAGIEQNCRTVVGFCAEHGIKVAGVTKAVCGLPKVARALLRGGVAQLADSRIENVRHMREDGISAEIMMLRIPMLSETEAVVALTDYSLNSEPAVIKALSEQAERQGKTHRIVLMIDTGDLREGVLPDDALAVAANIVGLPGLELYGVGTNLACLSGVQPSARNMELLVHIAGEIRTRLSIELPMVSGGNTFNLPLVAKGESPVGINHLRLGAGILMAAPPLPPALEQVLDAHTFRLHAEVLELKDKPSQPYGSRGKDAFGHKPKFEDKGTMKRAIVGIGREDVDPESVRPVGPGLEVLGASSDHLILDVTKAEEDVRVGSELVFELDYGAVLAAMTSEYVHKQILYQPQDRPRARQAALIGVPVCDPAEPSHTDRAPRTLREQGLAPALAETGIAVRDHGDIAEAPGGQLERVVQAAVTQGDIPVVLGGPHGIVHAVLAGLSRVVQEIGLICFDAHGDLVTSILSGDYHARIPLSLENFVLLGVRAPTHEEKTLLARSAITVFTMEKIDRLGMVEVMRRALGLACGAVDGLHVSIDMDFADPAEAPGVVAPKPGGINYREAHLAMEMIAETGKLMSVDIAELDPARDEENRTAKLAVSLLASLMGRKVMDG